MPQSPAEIRDLIGSRIERFVIKARLGSGGMGEVFLADDTLLKRPVALKAIRPDRCEDSSFRQRLVREAERASQPNDEHIVRIYQLLEHDGRTFLVMEYVEGQTLRTKLGKPLATEEFFSIAEQCLAGLAAAHQRGILHCDLKPENVMITPAGLVKLLDFGFARHAAPQETRDRLDLNSTGVGGTVPYMAPEVLTGKLPDPRSDIFSLGVMLYEALTGSHPFCAEWAVPVAGQILQEKLRPIRRPVLAGLDVVLLRMLAKDPAQRYQNCADALADLRAVHAGRTPPPEPGRARSGLRSRIAISLTAMLVFGLLLTSWPPLATQHGLTQSARLLVVLPFRPISEEAGDRALASGLTETLTAKLGQIADRYPVETVPASEVRAQNVKDPKQARTIMGATLVLEGSLQQSGRTVRVIYSLVDARSQHQEHSGVITADASNPFAVQDRVIEEVLAELNIELGKEDKRRMEAHPTAQAQAYDSYLRGRGYLHEYDRPENLDSAIAAFQGSLTKDPRFALAYSGLGQAYLKKYAIAHLPESVLQAKDACARAVELDDGKPDGEICLGMLFDTTGRYKEAAQHLERAVNLDAGNDESYLELAVAYEGLNRPADAERSLKRAIALRPLHWSGYRRLGWLYNKNGRDDEAVEQFQHLVDLAPDSFSGYSNLGAVYVLQGKYAAAIEALERSIAIRQTSNALSNLGVAYFYQHNYQDAARIYELAVRMTPNNYIAFGNLGEAYGQIPGKQEESRTNYTHALQLAEQSLNVNAKDGEALSYAALYTAHLDQKAKAEQYRTAALMLSANAPEIRKNSALVLAQLHQDRRALAELGQAVKQGVPSSQIENDPAWQRFTAHPQYVAIIARARRK
jgi:serine/threonine-protein kinase